MWRRFLLIPAFVFATLCGSMHVHAASVETDYDTSADLSQLHYYQWSNPNDGIDAKFSTLNDDAVKQALSFSLDRQMAMASDEHPADVLVRYYIKPVKKIVDDRPRVGIGVGGYGSNVGGGFSFNFPLGGNNLDQQAHVVVDFLEPKTQKLLWRGSLITGMSSTSAQINQKQLQKATDEILNKFPPR